MISTKNTKKTILESFKKADVNIEYYWNSHGRLVEFVLGDRQTSWKDVKVRLEEHAFCVKALEEESNFVDWLLFINGKQLEVSIDSYEVHSEPSSGKWLFFCRAVVGWG